MPTLDTNRSLALRSAAEKAVQFLNGDGPVNATVDATTLRERLCVPLPSHGIDAVDVIEHLCDAVEGGADWLTATWDQNAALYACSPARAIVEEAAGAWLKELLALPKRASFSFVTGCQMAHVTCLAAARHALLARQPRIHRSRASHARLRRTVTHARASG